MSSPFAFKRRLSASVSHFNLFIVLLLLLCVPNFFALALTTDDENAPPYHLRAPSRASSTVSPAAGGNITAVLSMMCTLSTAESIACPAHLPQCCQPSSFVRCCPANVSCDLCTAPERGFLMSRGSVIVCGLSLLLFVLLGSVTCAGIGRFLAWKVERRRIVTTYREHAALQRKEMRAYQQELASVPARQNVPEREACVVCCARQMNCAFAPCGHVCCCQPCARRMEQCAVCRGTVERYYTLPPYLVRRMVNASAAVEWGGAGVGSPSPQPEVVELGDGEEMAEVAAHINTKEGNGDNTSPSSTSAVNRVKRTKGEGESNRKWEGKSGYKKLENDPE